MDPNSVISPNDNPSYIEPLNTQPNAIKPTDAFTSNDDGSITMNKPIGQFSQDDIKSLHNTTAPYAIAPTGEVEIRRPLSKEDKQSLTKDYQDFQGIHSQVSQEMDQSDDPWSKLKGIAQPFINGADRFNKLFEATGIPQAVASGVAGAGDEILKMGQGAASMVGDKDSANLINRIRNVTTASYPGKINEAYKDSAITPYATAAGGLAGSIAPYAPMAVGGAGANLFSRIGTAALGNAPAGVMMGMSNISPGDTDQQKATKLGTGALMGAAGGAVGQVVGEGLDKIFSGAEPHPNDTWSDYLDKNLGPNTKADLNTPIKDAVKQTISDQKQALGNLTSPLYDKAYPTPIHPDTIQGAFQDQPGSFKIFNQAQNDLVAGTKIDSQGLAEDYKLQSPNTLGQLDTAKKLIQDRYDSRLATGKIGYNESLNYKGALNTINKIGDDASPEFTQARALYKSGTQDIPGINDINNLQSSKLGQAAYNTDAKTPNLVKNTVDPNLPLTQQSKIRDTIAGQSPDLHKSIGRQALDNWTNTSPMNTGPMTTNQAVLQNSKRFDAISNWFNTPGTQDIYNKLGMMRDAFSSIQRGAENPGLVDKLTNLNPTVKSIYGLIKSPDANAKAAQLVMDPGFTDSMKGISNNIQLNTNQKAEAIVNLINKVKPSAPLAVGRGIGVGAAVVTKNAFNKQNQQGQ